MKQIKILLLTLIFLAIPMTVAAKSQWQSLKTDHFTVFYPSGRAAQARETLNTLEFYRPQLEQFSGNQARHLAVVLDDTGVLVNGFATPLNNAVHLFQFAPTASAWSGGVENWGSLVGVHEYTHHLTLSATSGLPGALRNLFGASLWFMPNLALPGWFSEGIAVYRESQASPFQGRLNDGVFDAYLSALAAADRFPSLLDATYDPFGFDLQGEYTLGSEFLRYLARTYGEASLTEFLRVNGSGAGVLATPLPGWGMDQSAKKAFGKTFPQLWQDWQEDRKQQAKPVTTEGEAVTRRGWNTESPLIVNGKLYYYHHAAAKTGAFRQYATAELIEHELATGREKVLVATTSNFGLQLQSANGQLYYATMEAKPGYANSANNSYGYQYLLHQRSLGSGRDKVILSQTLRSFAVTDRGQVIYARDRQDGFGSELIELDPATGAERLRLRLELQVDEIAIRGNQVVLVARRDWENDNLYQLDLANGTVRRLTDTPEAESNLRFAGANLLFNANYGGEVSAYAYAWDQGRFYRLVDQGFAAAPTVDPATGILYYLGLTASGFDIYRKPLRLERSVNPPSASAHGSPVKSPAEASISAGSYFDNLKTMTPANWSPVINWDQDRHEAGVAFSGADAIGDFPAYRASLAYDAKQQKLNTTVELAVAYWAPLQLRLGYWDREQRVYGLVASYPVYTSLSPGLSDFTLGGTVIFDPDYQGPELEPFLGASFHYPQFWGSLKLRLPRSQTQFGYLRQGVYGELTLNQVFAANQLSVAMETVNDPDNFDPVIPSIRGYQTALEANRGGVYRFEYSRPLLQIRTGLWNPNVYLEDLGLVLFQDGAFAAGERQISWGAELHVETKAALVVPFDWGLRVSGNIDGEAQVGVFGRIQLD